MKEGEDDYELISSYLFAVNNNRDFSRISGTHILDSLFQLLSFDRAGGIRFLNKAEAAGLMIYTLRVLTVRVGRLTIGSLSMAGNLK